MTFFQRIAYIWRTYVKLQTFFFFGLGSLVQASVVFPTLFLFSGFSRKRFSRWARYAIHIALKILIWQLVLLRGSKFKVEHRERLKGLHSKIIIANHPSLLDVVLLFSIIPNADCIVKGALGKNRFVSGIVNSIYILNSESFDQQMMGRECAIANFEKGTAGDDMFFLQLFNAIAQRSVLTIEYRRFGMEVKERTIHPYHLKQYMGRWYLFATIEGKDYITCFALDRILSVRQNKEVGFRETTVDFNHYFDDIVGVTHPDNGVMEHIVIEGDSWAEYYLHTLPIHPLQQLESLGEEGCRLTMDLMVNRELEREILSYGEHLRVKAPESLRSRMAALLGILLEEYREEVRDRLVNPE